VEHSAIRRASSGPMRHVRALLGIGRSSSDASKAESFGLTRVVGCTRKEGGHSAKARQHENEDSGSSTPCLPTDKQERGRCGERGKCIGHDSTLLRGNRPPYQLTCLRGRALASLVNLANGGPSGLLRGGNCKAPGALRPKPYSLVLLSTPGPATRRVGAARAESGVATALLRICMRHGLCTS
jgi:hypothetical protein